MNLLGKLTWHALPLDQPIPMVTSCILGLVIAGVVTLVLVKGWAPFLWREYITSVDHKKIGIMYCLLALVMLLRGFSDALLMRSQQAVALHSNGFLQPEHYNQIFSAHGTIMIFFVAMPFVIGLMNFVVPLQLGVRDVAFPTLNSVGFWLTATGALLVNISLVLGEFARTGWLPYPPLSELRYSPGVGVDYYLWALQISGRGHFADRNQSGHHHPQDAGAGNAVPADADVLLDVARLKPADHRRFSGADRHPRDADPGPLPRLPLLHQ